VNCLTSNNVQGQRGNPLPKTSEAHAAATISFRMDFGAKLKASSECPQVNCENLSVYKIIYSGFLAGLKISGSD
jgi:hypothetical protein